MADKPFKVLIDIIESGWDRILTSGQKVKAFDGVELLHQLNKKARGDISIMAGAGVNSSNINDIIRKTGLHEVHMSGHTLMTSCIICLSSIMSASSSNPRSV